MPVRLKPEEALQVATKDFLAACACPDVLWFHPAQEAIRSPITWKIQKRMGFVKGIPDWIFLRAGWCGMVELKAGKGKLRPAQENIRDWAERYNVDHAVARTLDEFIGICKRWGIVRIS